MKQVAWTLDQKAAKYNDEHLTKSNHRGHFKLIKILGLVIATIRRKRSFADTRSDNEIREGYHERIWRKILQVANKASSESEKLHLDKKTFIFKQICLPLSKEIVNAF